MATGGRTPDSEARPGSPGAAAATPRPAALALAGGFLLAGLFVYWGSFQGPFFSDDLTYIVVNDFIQELNRENLIAILDPAGPTGPLTGNYAPVHLLLHAAEWHLFGTQVFGYHVVNVLVHVLVSLLFVRLLRTSRVPAAGAWIAGAVFLLHPANVEAVAWISQLKTTSALALGLAAVLLHPRRPALAPLVFGLALLAKPVALFALPVAFLLDWSRGIGIRWGRLAVWLAVFAAFAVVEFGLFHDYGRSPDPLHPERLVWARTIVAFAMRYAVMAATSWGTSTFHEPPAAVSWLDPWWLTGALLLGLLAWRMLHTLRRRQEEAAYWVWAAVSFAPVSQVFPFTFPIADRYLYPILPGLIGGVVLLGLELWRDRRFVSLGEARRLLARRIAVGAAAVLLLGFGLRSAERARLWRSSGLLFADAAAHYPEGRHAHELAARRAAMAGDFSAAAAALQRAFQAGFDRIEQVIGDPLFARGMGHPGMQAVVRNMAELWIRRVQAMEQPDHADLSMLSIAYESQGDLEAAEQALERAVALGGFENDVVRARLAELRARKARLGVSRPRQLPVEPTDIP